MPNRCASDLLKHQEDRLAKAVTQLSEFEREVAAAKAACRPLELTVEQLKQEKARHDDEVKWLNEQLQAKVFFGVY